MKKGSFLPCFDRRTSMNRYDGTAEALAKTLWLVTQGRVLKAEVRLDGRIHFCGGRQGEHSLDISVSSVERVLAHWEGYCENNTTVPVIGQVVSFPSGSASSGMRRGKVVKVGPKRVTVEYTYKHGGRAAPKAVKITDIRI